MDGVSEETSASNDVEDREIYIPFLCTLINRLANRKGDPTKLQRLRRAYTILTNRNNSARTDYVEVRSFVKSLHNSYRSSERVKSEHKSHDKKQVPTTSERGEHSSLSRTSSHSHVEIRSPDRCRRTAESTRSPRNDLDDIVVIDTDEERLQVGKVCEDIRRLSHESGDTSCKSDETNDHKVSIIHYLDWKFIPVCGLQLKPARSIYSSGSVTDNGCDPRLRSMPPTSNTPTAVDDDPMELVSSPEASQEPIQLAFDNNKLTELLKWTQERIQSGINVGNMCNLTSGGEVAADNIDKDGNSGNGGEHSTPTIKSEAGSETYYRDVTPFHLLLQGGTPPTTVKTEQFTASTQGVQSFKKKKKKKKKKVKTEPGIQSINCKGEIIDVEYETRRRERKLAEEKEKEKEEVAKRSKDGTTGGKSNDETGEINEVRDLDRLTIDEPGDEHSNSRASGVGCAMAERESHKQYERYRENKLLEHEWIRTEERRKREEKRDAERREERAKRHRLQQQQFEVQQRFAMNHNGPFGYGVPMMPCYPMPFYPQMPNMYGQPFVAPYAPMRPPQRPQPVQHIQLDGSVDCIFCPFSGELSLIMNHYVNDHLDKEPPVMIPADQLRSILRGEVVEEEQGKKENVKTGIAYLDDLSSIPIEIRFLEPRTCKLCNYSTNIRRNLIEHIQSHRKAVLNQQIEEKLHNCRFCPITMSDVKKFHEHCTSHTGEFMYACGYCGFRGYSSEDVRGHSNKEHPGRNVQIKRNGTVFGGTTVLGYVCPECGFVQMAEKKVESHIHTVHRKQHIQAMKINMAKVIPKPPTPKSVPQATVARPPPTPPRPVRVASKESSQRLPKRRPPVKIRGDPRTAPFRNNVEPSPPVDRRRAGVAGQRSSGPHKTAPAPMGPLLENGMLEGDDRNEPGSITVTSNDTARSSASSSVAEETRSAEAEKEQIESSRQPQQNRPARVPSYLTRCKLERVIVDDEAAGSADESQPLSDTEGDDEQEAVVVPIQDEIQGEMDVEEGESKLLTEEMKLVTEMDIEEPAEETTPETIIVKREVEVDNTIVPSADGTSSTGESSTMPTIADTISKLAGHLQSKAGTMNKKTKNTSAQTNGGVIPVSVNQENASRLSPRKISDWQMRMKSLICNCGFLCVSKEAFAKHRTHWHKGERRIHCLECNTRCDDVMAFTEHFQKTCNKITKKMFVCSLEPLCRFFTSSQQQFLSHIKSAHDNLEWLPCHWCGKQYTTPDCLVTHIHRMCTTKENLLSALQTASIVTKIEDDSRNFSIDVTNAESIDDLPAAPRLEVVYRCAFLNCKHRSLEREVFIDHMHVDHPDKTDYVCTHCEEMKFKNLNSLILHIENKHREGANDDVDEVVVATTTSDELAIVPSPQSTEPVPSTSHDADEPTETAEPTHVPSETANGAAAAAVEDVAPLPVTRFSLDSMEVMCRSVALHFQVLSSSTLDGEVFRENLRSWRASHIENRGNIQPLTLETRDLVAFAREQKSPEALREINQIEKLIHLYKCGSRNCSYTTNDDSDFRCHLSSEVCRDGTSMVCLYCGDSHRTVRGITDHITFYHGESVNQCLECTFRCRQIGSILIHTKKRHEGDVASSVKCDAPVVQANESFDNEGPDLLSLIMPVLCTADECDFITMDVMAIQGHIRDSHPTLQIYDCFHCGHKVDLRDLEVHFERHNIYKFQCRYCSFGTNNGNEVVVHVCEMHPNRTGRVYIRATMNHQEQQSASAARHVPVPHAIPSTYSALPGGITIKDEPVEEPPDRSEVIANPVPTVPVGTTPAAANIFSCGYQQCRFSAPTILALDEHIQECSKVYVGARLCCKQCRTPFRNMTSFLNHVRSHQAKLYYCGLCDYNKQLIYYVKNHMQTVHGLQFTETKCVPRYPSGSGSDMAEFVFEPTLPSLRIRIDPNAGAAVLPPAQAVAVAHAEQVGDIDSIPLQSIFSKEIKCAHCDFATKVRTNLIRHLEQHKSTENDPKESTPSTSHSVAPQTGTGGSGGGGGVAIVEPGLALWHPTVFPDYFSKEERYRCCVKRCPFRASDSATFEDHVSKEHTNLLVFSCPHCSINTDVMANLIRHLSLHGPNLYKCPYCTYVNVGRQLVLGHGLAEHPGVPNYVNIVREKQELNIQSQLLGRMSRTDATNTTAQNEVRPSGSKVIGKYNCPLCERFQTAKISEMRFHMYHELKYKKYACNYCDLSTARKANIVRHIKRSHPNKSTNSFAVNRNENTEKLVTTVLEKFDSSPGKSRSVPRSQPPSKVTKPDVVEGTPRFHCPHCPHSVTKVSYIRNHILGHLNNQSYNCRLCRAHFVRVHQLRSHHNAQHPGLSFEISNETDKDITTFVDWVVKLIQDPVVQTSQSNFNLKPWTLPCKYDGCSRQFSSLKKFSDHFKEEHLQKKNKRPAEDNDRVSEVVSSEEEEEENVLLVRNAKEVSDHHRPSTSNSNPKRPPSKRRKLNSDGTEVAPAFTSLCPFCSYSKPGVPLADHIMRHYDCRFYKCKYCNFEGIDHSDIREHQKKNHVGYAFASERLKMPEVVNIRQIGTRDHYLIERGSLGSNYILNPDPDGQYWCYKCKYASSCLNSVRYHCQYAHGLGTYIRSRNTVRPVSTSPMVPECVLTTDDGDENAPKNDVECTMCEKVFLDMNTWLEHFNAEHIDPSETANVSSSRKKKRGGKTKAPSVAGGGGGKGVSAAFQCKYCSYSSVQVSLMKRHQQTQHSDMDVSYERIDNATVHQCPKCSYTSTESSEATTHILSHLHQFKCGLCDKTASTERAIQRHSASVHSMHRVRVIKNPEYERQKLLLEDATSSLEKTQEEISVENVCIQDGDGLEYQVLSSNPSSSFESTPTDTITADVASEPCADSLQVRTVARKSTCKSPQKVAPTTVGHSTVAGMKARMKRKIDWPLASHGGDSGFSFYGKRPLPLDTENLTVYTNFRGMQNARTTVDHLSEIFNLNPVVIVEKNIPKRET